MGVLLSKSLKTIAVLILIGITPCVYGQVTINDVKSSFNQAVQMEEVDPQSSISSYETVVELADKVGGEEAEQIKEQAQKRIPKMYYEAAKKLAGAKDYEESVEMLDASIEAYNALGNTRNAARSQRTVLSIRGVQASTAINEGNYNEALEFYDDALQRNPDYAKAYLGKLVVYNKMDDADKMEELAETGLRVAKKQRDNRTAGDIKKVMRGLYFKQAQTAMAEQDYVAVERNLNNSIKYGNNNVIVHYQLGLALKGQEKFNEAVQSFNKALELETGGAEDKARIFFELGEAYQALGQETKACESYKNALYGEFKEAAQYQIDNVLECNG